MVSRLRGLIWPDEPARRFLSVLLLVVTIQQALIILIFPPFSGHDEVAHFDYIRLVAQERRLPVIPDLDEWRAAIESEAPPPGDFISPDLYAYCLFTLEWWPCEPDNPALAASPPYRTTSELDGEQYPVAWQYAANHPPLYYVLAAPVQWLADGQGLGLQNRLLRALSIPFGLLVVVGTFALGRQVTPGRGFVPVAAAVFVAFQPQLAFSAAIVNNDVTVVAVGVWLLTLLVMGIRDGFSRRLVMGIGVLFGVGPLFKGTAIVFAPVIALALILGVGWRSYREWLPKGIEVAAIGFGLATPWYLYLWRTYGSLDGLDRVERLQAFWNYPAGAPGFMELLTDGGFIGRFWRELWGGFGWRRVPFDDGLLWAIGVVCALCVVGLVVEIVHRMQQENNIASVGVLAATVVVSYLAVVQFGTTFELAQARYAFPAMPALAVLLALGWQRLVPTPHRRYGLVIWVGLHLTMVAYVFSALVAPYWHLGAPR